MNKKYISILLIISLITAGLLTGCADNTTEQSAQDKMKEEILKEFSQISEIPRNNGSDMTGIQEYITKRTEDMGLKPIQDKAGNIIVEKTLGTETGSTTIIHTNMDMITKSDPSIIFDSEKDSISMMVNEGSNQIRGNKTSLGASSGIGMATALYLLENAGGNGNMRAVFTVDGEKDMSGAQKLDSKYLDGDYLINLNNVSEKSIETGSAFSSILKAKKGIRTSNTKNKYSFIIVADGFVGGAPETEENENKGNPVKFLAEVLALAKSDGLMFELNDFKGGDNPYNIPETATATITVNEYEKAKISSIFNKVKNAYLKDHEDTEPDARLEILETTVPDKTINEEDTGNLISFLYGLIDGEYESDSGFKTSSNVGIVNITDDSIECKIFIQSKNKDYVTKLTAEHNAIAKISDFNIKTEDNVSGFNTDNKSFLPTTLSEIYDSELNISGDLDYRPTRTELGIFQEKNPNLQIVSIGVTVKNECETDEYATLSTIDTPAYAVLQFLLKIK